MVIWRCHGCRLRGNWERLNQRASSGMEISKFTDDTERGNANGLMVDTVDVCDMMQNNFGELHL